MDDTVVADDKGREEVVDETKIEEGRKGNHAGPVIGEQHNDRATNITTLQMLKY